MQVVSGQVPRMAPLFSVGPYALYPLRVCSADAIATLFTKICTRGNPILQGKSFKDLHHLGVAFYNKSVGTAVSTVFLKGSEPVAVFFGWDIAEGGVWKDTSGPPESLTCHAAIGAAIFASMSGQVTVPGKQMFFAFSGVALPHPGHKLLLPMEIVAFLGAIGAGYSASFAYAVHPKTIEQIQAWPAEHGVRDVWRFTYGDIEVEDQALQEELSSISLGFAECCVCDLPWCMEKIEREKTVGHEMVEPCRPGAARMVASFHSGFDDNAFQMPQARL